MDGRGAKLMLSNSDPKPDEGDTSDELYNGFNPRGYLPKGISTMHQEGKINELVVRNYS